MKCANCDTQAAYVYKPTQSSVIPYCVPHMPGFLVPRMKAGLLDKADGFDDFLAEAIATTAPEMNRAIPHSNMTETAPEVEEEPVKPAKKASKKPSVVEPDVE